jgi:Uma2 family endonuclease
VRTLILDPPPAQLRDLLDRRRVTGADRHDEVWQGVHHIVPAPGAAHSLIAQQLAILLDGPARAAGLLVSVDFNLGAEDDYRVPDLGIHRGRPRGTWIPTAAGVVEILSPRDETWDKLPFYADQGVDELIVVDPATSSIDWRALHDGEYVAVHESALLDLDPDRLARQIDWPPADA